MGLTRGLTGGPPLKTRKAQRQKPAQAPVAAFASPPISFPVAGVGASAGGLEAFTQLLAAIPPHTGMAFVLIQHLDPTHPSLLGEALARKTAMPVQEIRDGTVLEPDHVYVIAPNTDVGLVQGVFTVLPRPDAARPHLPIDFFFRALAAEQRSQAIGVVLSGTASDGTAGLRAIKVEGGVTLVQDPETAAYDGMPRSALSAGVADIVLPIPGLAHELARLARHPYVARELREPPPSSADVDDMRAVLLQLRNAVGVDFSEYKESTIRRRLARRMALRKSETLRDYAHLLAEDRDESKAFFEDILIHVTSFFRDPGVFQALKLRVFPEILKHKQPDEQIRMWVPGCSTGEEAYSLAISLFEYLGDARLTRSIQIFGTDLSEGAIAKVRSGLYPESAVSHVSPAQLQQFFVPGDGGYRISEEIRDVCVFVRHDLARDPPFSKLDLVSCRNVLIYFNHPLQERALATFQYCLNTPGFLLLGHSEGLSGQKELFSVVDKANRIYARTAAASRPWRTSSGRGMARVDTVARPMAVPISPPVEFARKVDTLLLTQYLPASVIVNEQMDILLFRGRTAPYLESPPGEPDANLLKMARGGLRAPLRSALTQAKKTKAIVRKDAVDIEADGFPMTCNIVVLPLGAVRMPQELLYAVVFEVASARIRDTGKRARARGTRHRTGARGSVLEQELRTTKEYLESVIEDRDATNEALTSTNEELESANEELVSANEELQSLNEEMETSKEEIQSTNEELTTLNDELQNRNQELGQLSSDVLNLLDGVEIPIVIVDGGLRIRRFTPKAQRTMNFLPADVGRPITDIRANLSVKHLGQQISEVMQSVTPRELEVQDGEGRWYRMQIRPYKTMDNKIDGAVIALVDIDVLKQGTLERASLLRKAEEGSQAKDRFLTVLSHELRTPLATLLLQVDMLRRRARDGGAIGPPIDAIERAARVQARLTDDLLDISRIATGKLDLQLRDVSILATVREAVDMVIAIAEEKGVSLAMDLDDSTGPVVGDPLRLRQVVWNLLINAVKFTPAGGRVSILVDHVEGQARVQVTDTGVGIDAKMLPTIFDPFVQAEQGHGGLGLGLAIVRHVVELHHGTVDVASAGLHQGATFTVLLPMVAPTPERRAPADPTHKAIPRVAQRPPLNGVRILVVEDEDATREALVEMLRDMAAEVQEAASAAEGMRRFEEFRPELLICDIGMRGENGYSLMRRIRGLGPARVGDVSALALTAMASEKDRQEALAAGFQMHLAKPVGFDDVAEAVQTLYRRRLSERREVPDATPGASPK